MVDGNVPMFENVSSNWTVDQLALVRWCRFYNHYLFSVSEKERPPEDLAEYDRLFDQWIERREAKKKFEANRPSKGKGYRPVEELQEQYRGI